MTGKFFVNGSADGSKHRRANSGGMRERRAILGTWQAAAVLSAIAAFAIGTSVPRLAAQQSTTAATPPAAAAPAVPPANRTSEPAHPDDASTKPATIRTSVELVNVPFSAMNKRGLPVIDLNQEDFQVYEDGVEQKITRFERETSTPLRIGLIVDTSNTARRSMEYEKEAATEFCFEVLRNGGTKNQIFLQTFDSSSSVVQDFTNDPEILNEKIEKLKAGGGKALYDSIYQACTLKMRKSGPPEDVRRILIVLSDGLDVQSTHTIDQTISMARICETMIFTVGTAAYGFNNPGDKLLDQLSTETGGYPSYPLHQSIDSDMETGYLSHGQIGDSSQNRGLGAATGRFSAERLINLADTLQAIGRNLDEQYTLAYRPSHDSLDGTYRTIKLVIDKHGVILRWKPGYFAAAPE